MIPGLIQRKHVVIAFKTIGKAGIPVRRKLHTYAVKYGGFLYPPKLVVSHACKTATGRILSASRFYGGAETNSFLEELGFEIVKVGRGIRGVQGKIDELKQSFLTHQRCFTWNDLKENFNVIPASAGIYFWFFSRIPPRVPTRGCIKRNGQTLLYIGISPENSNSTQTLRKRVRYHFTGNAAGSTLRQTLGSLLGNRLKIALRRVGSGKRKTFADGEKKLSRWMERNAAVSWIIIPQPWRFEGKLIRNLLPPLNLEHNSFHQFYKKLKQIRSASSEFANKKPVLKLW